MAKAMRTISMFSLGLNTCVSTKSSIIRYWKQELSKNPDSVYAGGAGREALFNHLLAHIRFEDAHFNEVLKNSKHIDIARWDRFMDDCVLVAVLAEVLGKQPIAYIDPNDSTKGVFEKASVKALAQSPIAEAARNALH